MSPVSYQIDQVGSEHQGHDGHGISEMRRVSLSLAFSPARERRRRAVEAGSVRSGGGGLLWRRRRSGR